MIPACLAPTWSAINTKPPLTESFSIHLEKNINESCSFYNEWRRQCKVLVIGGQSIYAKHKNEFEEIKNLEDRQQEICEDQQIENDYENPSPEFIQKNQNEYDEIEEQIESKTESLKRKVTEDFDQSLGEERAHLAPQIAALFSPKALTSLAHLVDQKCYDVFKGIHTGKEVSKSITLHTPESQGPVEILAAYEIKYTEFLPNGKMKSQILNSPRHCTSFGHFIIQNDGTVDASGSFEFIS